MTDAVELAAPPKSGGYRALWQRNRSWRWLVVSIAVSTPGDLLYSIALAAELYRRTGDARWLGAVAVVAPLGRMVLAPLGGDMADRMDRRRIIITCNVLRALIMFLLTVFVVIEAHPLLLVGCVLFSAVVATPQRAASAALVPGVVDRSDLAVANAADAVVNQTAWLLGPAIGAALTSITGPAVAMFVNALTFVAAAACVTRIRLRPASEVGSAAAVAIANLGASPEADAPPKRFVARTLEGVAAIRTSKALRSVTLLLAGSLFVFGAEEVLTVLFAVDRLRLGDGGAGYLMTAGELRGGPRCVDCEYDRIIYNYSCEYRAAGTAPSAGRTAKCLHGRHV